MGNYPLGVNDLLAAMQFRRQKEQQDEGMNDPFVIKQKLIAERMAEEQLKAAQEANKMAEMKRSMLTPTGMPAATDSPYTRGYPAFAKAQEIERLLTLMNGGQPRGGGGGGGEEPSYAQQMEARTNKQAADQLALNESFNPPKPDPYDTFMQTTQEMKTQGQPSGGGNNQPTTVAELLADEQSNTAGYGGLLNQAKGKPKSPLYGSALTPTTTQDIMTGTTPVQDTVNKENKAKVMDLQTWLNTGSTVPPKEWTPEMRSTAADIKSQEEKDLAIKKEDTKTRIDNRKNQKTEINKYEADLYKNPLWKEVPANERADIKEKYMAFVKWVIKNNGVPDTQSFLDKLFVKE